VTVYIYKSGKDSGKHLITVIFLYILLIVWCITHHELPELRVTSSDIFFSCLTTEKKTQRYFMDNEQQQIVVHS